MRSILKDFAHMGANSLLKELTPTEKGIASSDCVAFDLNNFKRI